MRFARLLWLVLPLSVAGVGCPGTPADDDDTTGDGGLIEAPSLSVAHDPGEDLTELALEALEVVPDWVRDDLAIALLQQDEDVQDDLAQLIVDEGDGYLVDEIAFGIAHTSPEVIRYHSFYPELFVVNAQKIYEYDPLLDYVQLEDVGEPGVDEGYYTTATYRVGDESGAVTEKTIDREIYYWYVVHPRLEDELPVYLDAWSSSVATSPQSGMFWREFLWDKAADECPPDRTCPLLEDMLPGVDTLWNSKAETRTDNGAIGEIIQYVWDAIDFGAGDERPVQPARIYTVGAGNCGEHADLTSAAARIGLIPSKNVGARSNDHTWDEFWDDRWIAWEPIGTHVDYFGYYKGGVGRDGVDNDCDGWADDALSSADEDGDGFTIEGGDCHDGDAEVNPLADEVPNGHDDDCDGVADDGFADADLDVDGDGFSIAAGDCHEADGEVYPGAPEQDNGRDDDCDGIADDGLDASDADTDGFSIAAGDCDDNDATVFPGAVEVGNARDDDCDGVADDLDWDPYGDVDGDGYAVVDGDCNDTDPAISPGVAEIDGNDIDDDCDGDADGGFGLEDHDGDGMEPIFGDCNDADPAIHPNAEEICNGIDDDCDGETDEGLYGSDRDGDGFTIEQGDCDDRASNVHPDRQDPTLSSNKLYAMTEARGDTYIDEWLTENYVTLPSYLDFEVTDEDGRPVDGAIVTIYGTWSVYGAPNQWAWAAELVTELDGTASAVVGEYNRYGFAVTSPVGEDPGEGSLYEAVEQTEPHESYSMSATLDGEMPPAPDVEVDDLTGGATPQVVWSIDVAVDGHRLDVDGAYSGSFSLEREGGRVDLLVVDEDNLDAFDDRDEFSAQLAELDVENGSYAVELPLSDDWTLVVGNTDSSTAWMIGTVTVRVEPADGYTFSGDVAEVALERRFRIPPGDHLEIELSP